MRSFYFLTPAGAALILLLGTACASTLGPDRPGAQPQMARQGDGVHDGLEHWAHEGHSSDAGQGSLFASHEHDPALPRLLRRELWRGWCEPPAHAHLGGCGTPYVHGFATEPAFLGRDIFLDVTRAAEELELEAELEWSLTRRLGLVAELPYVDADEAGFGDAGIGLRALLVEERRFLLSASTEFELPTGSERRGLGSGNVALGAHLHTWADLGYWVTLQAQAGLGHVPAQEETEFAWSATLAKSFRAHPLIRTRHDGHGDHGPTVFSLLAEVQGLTSLSEETGSTHGRWLLGASYPLTHRLDLRGAFSRSFGGDEDEDAWTLGLILHL